MSNDTTQSLQLTLGFDRSLVSRRRQSVRYLVADLTVSDAPKEQVSSDTPMNLSIVIDASGSMTGAPLAYAKSAARGVIERLQDHDRLSLVSFADHVITHMEPTRLNRDARNRLLQAVAELGTRGCTNLCAGWLEGAEWSAIAAGHCRYATHGSSDDNRNNHPHHAGREWIVKSGENCA